MLVGAYCAARDARPAAPAHSLGSLWCCPALGCLFPSLAHISQLRFGRLPSLGLILQVGHLGLAHGTEQPRVPLLKCPSPRCSQPQTPSALLRLVVLPGLEQAWGSGPSCWVLGCDSPSWSWFPPRFKDANLGAPPSRLLPSPVRGHCAVAHGALHRSFRCLAASPDKQTSGQQLRGAGNQGAAWLSGCFRSLQSMAEIQVCHFPFPPPLFAIAYSPQPW